MSDADNFSLAREVTVTIKRTGLAQQSLSPLPLSPTLLIPPPHFPIYLNFFHHHYLLSVEQKANSAS
jgi:hypothetical protein